MTPRLYLRLQCILLLLAVIANKSLAFVPNSVNSKPRNASVTAKPSFRLVIVSRSQKSDETDGAADKMLDGLNWRAAKMKLEEENTRRFLKRKPVKLPYLDARKWVQRNLGPDTKEEFDDLVANGNLRTPYIPKQPEQYYSETGDWVSWDHFLTWDPKVLGREVPPATGRFDWEKVKRACCWSLWPSLF